MSEIYDQISTFVHGTCFVNSFYSGMVALTTDRKRDHI